MNKEQFWIFGHLGLGDAIVCNALYRHYAKLYQDKIIIIPCWIHNLAAIQWMLSDVTNIFFYPVETEYEFLTCNKNINRGDKLELGFYSEFEFNPVKWDSEFYRHASLVPEIKWSGFKLPDFDRINGKLYNLIVYHEDIERDFIIRREFKDKFSNVNVHSQPLDNSYLLSTTCSYLNCADEIHCIDSSMLNLADLMETPYCKRFFFHQYARKGLPPTLKKNWEIII